MLRPRFGSAFVAFFMMAGTFALGTALGALHVGTQEAVQQLKWMVRSTLGLPKFWVPPPVRDVGNRTEAPCPDPGTALVIVTGGQSNAANSNSSRTTTDPDDNVFTLYEGRCYVTQDPVLGATGSNGSLWPRFGHTLATATGRPVVFVHGAVGGTQVADWLDRRSGYLDRLLEAIHTASQLGYRVDWILWHQGETDAKVQKSPEPFVAAMSQLAVNLLEAAPDARLYLFRASKCMGADRDGGVEMITLAQTRVAEANTRIYLGINTDQFGNEYRHDHCHFNDRGREAVVSAVAAELIPMLAAPD